MSGGHFDYQQYRLGDIADSIESAIEVNNVKSDEFEWVQDYSPETIAEFKTAVDLLRRAHIYAQRIDWLLSGDDGEKQFHERLHEELSQLL